MRAGNRRHFITIEQQTPTKSATGAVSQVWTTFVQLWGSIEFLKGYEKQSVSAAWPGADYKIGFNYIEGILPTMRVKFDNKIYSILAVNDIDFRHREIELICQSGVKAI